MYSAEFELPRSASRCVHWQVFVMWLVTPSGKPSPPEKCVALLAFLLILCGQSVDLQSFVLNYREMRL